MSIAGGVSWEQVLVPLKAIALPWVLLFLFYMFLGVDIVFHGVYVFFCVWQLYAVVFSRKRVQFSCRIESNSLFTSRWGRAQG